MTLRQSFLKLIYPMFMKMVKRKSANPVRTNQLHIKPVISFYDLKAIANNGKLFSFSELKGKKVMVVNTASNCAYTNQYDDLEKLYAQQKDKLVVIGFPSNDYKDQEQGSDEEIASFCKMNYGVTFKLMQKSHVRKGTEQNEVFQWLTNASKNGWNNHFPSWNFSKYLINENGELTHYFEPSVSPLDKQVLDATK